MRLRWRLRGVLKEASPLLSDFYVKIFQVPSKMVPKMAVIRGNGGLNIRFYVRDPEKAHPCAEPRVLAYFASKSVPLVCNLAHKVTHARKRNPWVDCDELLHRCRGPRRNHLCQFLWLPLTGCRRGGGSNFRLLHWPASSPLQHSRGSASVWPSIALPT